MDAASKSKETTIWKSWKEMLAVFVSVGGFIVALSANICDKSGLKVVLIGVFITATYIGLISLYQRRKEVGLALAIPIAILLIALSLFFSLYTWQKKCPTVAEVPVSSPTKITYNAPITKNYNKIIGKIKQPFQINEADIALLRDSFPDKDKRILVQYRESSALDKPFAKQLFQQLERLGHNVQWAPAQVLPASLQKGRVSVIRTNQYDALIINPQ